VLTASDRIPSGITPEDRRRPETRSGAARVCPACQADGFTVLHTQRLTLPDQFDLPESFDLVSCRSCGMVYSDVDYTGEQLQAYYSSDTYEFGSQLTDERLRAEPPSSPADHDRLAWLSTYVSDNFLDKTTRILDIGCASGLLLALLRQEGFSSVQGIDPSAQAVRNAQRYGLDARTGSLECLPGDLGEFDLVIMSHVLEHVLHTPTVLAQVTNLLAPGGQVYIEVPDASRYGEYLVEPFNEINLEHINHFSLGHLSALLAAQGYRRVSVGQREFALTTDWPYPAIYGRWTPTAPADQAPGSTEGRTDLDDSAALARSVLRYIAGSTALIEKIDRWLLRNLGAHTEVTVRCLGYRAWTLLGASVLRNLDVVRAIDVNPLKQQWSLRGVPVLSPAEDLDSVLPVVVLAYQIEGAVRAEYQATCPGRLVLCLGRTHQLPD
jgi:SAM-dependent methyltransferase